MELKETIEQINGYSAYQLSEFADCGAPDNPDSIGAAFLRSVRDNIIEKQLNGEIETDKDHSIMTIVVGAPEVGTHSMWAEFVDLAAWQQEFEDDEDEDKRYKFSDLDNACRAALEQIARRLCEFLIDELESVTEPTYCIVRYFESLDYENVVVETGLSLEDAQAHCEDSETSSDKCTNSEGIKRTADFGPWFDGLRKE